jgi:alpha-methylacyl-CoA racemase
MPGSLDGIRVVDLTGLGPGPFCSGMLADNGAEVIRVERRGTQRFREPHKWIPHRGRRSIMLDITTDAGRDVLLQFIDRADVLLEGFRPGVMERLGLGPEVCASRNPRLIYARMTGWGQDGPMANDVGHDINYLSVVGALGAFRRAGGRPLAPLNLVGDYGGGGMLMAFGITSALYERERSGLGQVIDAAMVDGVAAQVGIVHAYRAMDMWATPGNNMSDSGAPYYDVYETADHRYLAVGAVEAKFYDALIVGLGLSERTGLPGQNDRSRWPEMKALVETTIAGRTLDEWMAVFADVECCVTPVLEWDEAVEHPHLRARGTYVEVDGVMQPGVAPRYSRTPGDIGRPAPAAGVDTEEILAELGLSTDQIATLRADSIVS